MKEILLINLLMVLGLIYVSEIEPSQRVNTPRPTSGQVSQSLPEVLLSPTSQQAATLLAWWERQDTRQVKPKKTGSNPSSSMAQRNQQERNGSNNGKTKTESKSMVTPYTRVWRDQYPEPKA